MCIFLLYKYIVIMGVVTCVRDNMY